MRPVFTFTDFGVEGPYLGQMRAALLRTAPMVPVIDLMADAPAFAPKAAGFLLAALAEDLPDDAVILAVVDPGVGGRRDPVVVQVGERLFVGPDNGLFEPAMRRGGVDGAWRIDWRPANLSSSFHRRDLFAPVAGRLAAGHGPEGAGCAAIPAPHRPDWPDDLGEIIYVDRYGNAMTGLRASRIAPTAAITVNGMRLGHARTFSDVPEGSAFWYGNSCGLVELAVNCGAARDVLGVFVGSVVAICEKG